jgi:hypothetical protein
MRRGLSPRVIGVQVNHPGEAGEILANFEGAGFAAPDLADDELATLHIRLLVGGHSALARDELLYRLEFPERPGPLMRFLAGMSPNGNISLFHYRNHGADDGRILVGIQVPPKEMGDFRQFLTTLGYRHWDERQHPAYRLFLVATGNRDRLRCARRQRRSGHVGQICMPDCMNAPRPRMQVSILEAKRRLSELVGTVQAGDEVEVGIHEERAAWD